MRTAPKKYPRIGPWALAALSLSARASAFGESAATTKALEACLNRGTDLSLCEELRKINDGASRASQALLKQAGLDGPVGAFIAGAAQAASERRVKVTGSVAGARTGFVASPGSLELTVAWGF
jgi:hypothetical protein